MGLTGLGELNPDEAFESVTESEREGETEIVFGVCGIVCGMMKAVMLLWAIGP